MAESNTFESIMNRMLAHVESENPDLDTRPGSIIYTALAPIALELETAYHEKDMILDEMFLETASKEYLVKFGNQVGVEIREATCGHYRGEFNVNVAIGSRFNSDKFNYAVIEKLSNPSGTNQYYTFELVCETAGSEPNDYFDNHKLPITNNEGTVTGYGLDLTPITNISNLRHAKLVSIGPRGEDEEDTEVYRYRIQTSMKNPAIGGNVAQYKAWLDEYDGVGSYKIVPCWNGVNTVKLIVLDTNNQPISDSKFLTDIQTAFDPPTGTISDNKAESSYPQGRGMGNGYAPIGSVVTVITPTAVPVKVTCQLAVKDGVNPQEDVKKAVDAYLKSIAFEKKSVDYMAISAEIYNVDGVEDINSLSITVKGTKMEIVNNQLIPSVTLGDEEVAVLDENSVWG